MQQPFATRLPFVQPRTGDEDEEDEALEQNRRVIEDATADQLLPRTYRQNANGTTGGVRAGDRVRRGRCARGVLRLQRRLGGDGRPQRRRPGAGRRGRRRRHCPGDLRLGDGPVRLDDASTPTSPVTRCRSSPTRRRRTCSAFDLSAADGADYMASGEVDGELLGQYSMSEHEGFLRVATTTWAGGFGDSQESGVHVLERQGEFARRGRRRDGLGIGEEIQAVRFLGDIGYVVTFRQVDPLFVLDLSDPTAPALDRRAEGARVLDVPPPRRRGPAAGDRLRRRRQRVQRRHAALAVRRQRSHEPDAALDAAARRLERGGVRPARVPVLAGDRAGRRAEGGRSASTTSSTAPRPSSPRSRATS